MLRALIVAGIAGVAAVAGRELYRNGSLQRLGADLKRRGEDLKARMDDLQSSTAASHEAAGGPGGGPIRPMAVHNHKVTTAPTAH
ncbi:MAG TPA: hypothetical protein VF475_00660 [Sphingobium sp.]